MVGWKSCYVYGLTYYETKYFRPLAKRARLPWVVYLERRCSLTRHDRWETVMTQLIEKPDVEWRVGPACGTHCLTRLNLYSKISVFNSVAPRWFFYPKLNHCGFDSCGRWHHLYPISRAGVAVSQRNWSCSDDVHARPVTEELIRSSCSNSKNLKTTIANTCDSTHRWLNTTTWSIEQGRCR